VSGKLAMQSVEMIFTNLLCVCTRASCEKHSAKIAQPSWLHTIVLDNVMQTKRTLVAEHVHCMYMCTVYLT
jgi:hypothetical protein